MREAGVWPALSLLRNCSPITRGAKSGQRPDTENLKIAYWFERPAAAFGLDVT